MNANLRWAVLERDGFACVYCGRRPPEIVLHVDHMLPRSKGGADSFDNLVAACQDCNLGKGVRDSRRAVSMVDRLARAETDATTWQELALREFSRINDLEAQLDDVYHRRQIEAEKVRTLRERAPAELTPIGDVVARLAERFRTKGA